jgi:hypothetical protein
MGHTGLDRGGQSGPCWCPKTDAGYTKRGHGRFSLARDETYTEAGVSMGASAIAHKVHGLFWALDASSSST